MRRAAVATWALAARVNLWTVRRTSIPAVASFPRPPRRIATLSRVGGRAARITGVETRVIRAADMTVIGV